MAPLNPNARAFVPNVLSQVQSNREGSSSNGAVLERSSSSAASEDQVTAQDLEELDACDAWCHTMAYLEDLEREHLIELALRSAPTWKLELIHKRVGMVNAVKRKSKPANSGAGFW